MKLLPVFKVSLLMAGLCLLGASSCRRPVAEVPSVSKEGKVPRLKELDFRPFESALALMSAERLRAVTRLIQESTVRQLQRSIQRGEVTSEELTLVILDRIRRYDGRLRSYIELNPLCLDEARKSDAKRAKGEWLGDVHGIPLNLKDNIGTAAPMHTTAGAEVLMHHSPEEDARLVTQLRDPGAVILGKAALSELAGVLTTEPAGYNAVSGIGVNPYGDNLPVSGSSSGSAISTNAALAVLSVGTETSGSLISPASMNGVVAMKPSLGVISGDGVVPLIRFQDSAGPVARSVEDAAVLLGVMGSDEKNYAGGLAANALEGVAVGVLRKGILAEGDGDEGAEWLGRIDEGLKLSKAVSRDVGDPFRDTPELFPVLCLGFSEDTMRYVEASGTTIQTVADLKRYNEADRARRMPQGQNILDVATRVLAAISKETGVPERSMSRIYEEAAKEVRAKAAGILERAFSENEVEVLVSLGNAHSVVYATGGYPAITIPLGLNAEGAPNGVTFIGRLGEDAKLLAYAYAFEQATRYRCVPASTRD